VVPFKRVLLKLSGEALMGSAEFGLDARTVDELASELVRVRADGLEIALVICCVLPAVLGTYTFYAARARKHLSRAQTVRWVQRGTGAVMAGAAVAVATR